MYKHIYAHGRTGCAPLSEAVPAQCTFYELNPLQHETARPRYRSSNTPCRHPAPARRRGVLGWRRSNTAPANPRPLRCECMDRAALTRVLRKDVLAETFNPLTYPHEPSHSHTIKTLIDTQMTVRLCFDAKGPPLNNTRGVIYWCGAVVRRAGVVLRDRATASR